MLLTAAGDAQKQGTKLLIVHFYSHLILAFFLSTVEASSSAVFGEYMSDISSHLPKLIKISLIFFFTMYSLSHMNCFSCLWPQLSSARRLYVFKLSFPFLWTWYLKGALKECFCIRPKCPLGLKDEVVRFKWSKVNVMYGPLSSKLFHFTFHLVQTY